MIPSKVVKRELKVSYEEVHRLMTFLSTKEILKPKYKILCENNCLTGASKSYDDLDDIPINICDRCERECVLLEKVIIEFEVCN
ncbi:hypothetical protein Z959_08820 [Clostridium novyi B str. ATCC 27606]|uniref:Uncharacterized protein n=2 Tax=Clostridium novyi TaxID=1542 RepID=A0AA40IV13_CLONO|nr:hypothetical protein Z959_08820 [Clostridium novyi B str. ATCC 27606]